MIEITETPSGEISYAFAGDTLNTAVYLAREFGETAHRIDYLTALGTDPFSERMMASWQQEGVGTDLVLQLEDELPGLYWVSNSVGGERRFHYWRSASAARKLMQHTGTFAGDLESYDIVYLSGITLAILDEEGKELLLQLLAALRRAGVLIIYDSNYRPALWESVEAAREWLLKLAALSTVGLVSLEDERILFDDVAPDETIGRLQEHGVSEIVVKDGENMCTATEGRGILNIPVERVRQLDTTSAGDSFNAAYIAARVSGQGQEEAVRHAQQLAARVIQYRGAIIPA